MNLLIGISGGIAAYKTAGLVSTLVQDGHSVDVVMTRAACQFVGPTTFQTLSGRHVTTELFDTRFPLGAHIELAQNRQILCVAPTSADVLAKAAHGLADDLLSTLLLAFAGPVLLAPAMNVDMWERPSVQRNIATLRDDGFHFVGPMEGWQSCRRSGVGRMAEPAEIQTAIGHLLKL
jgi:phosphopantothenoylcysteine decarboxylase